MVGGNLDQIDWSQSVPSMTLDRSGKLVSHRVAADWVAAARVSVALPFQFDGTWTSQLCTSWKEVPGRYSCIAGGSQNIFDEES